MTIVDAAYSLCRELKATAARSRVADVVDRLTYGREGRANRSIFGYHARTLRKQFLGYLTVDQERDRLAALAPPIVIPPLDDYERRVLSAAHSQIVELNRRCVAVVARTLPWLSGVLDPYGRGPADEEQEPLDGCLNDAMANFALVFAQHAAVAFLCGPAASMHSHPSVEGSLATVDSLELAIVRAGVLSPPAGLLEFIRMEPRASARRASFKFTVALLSARATLRIMDQLIYQAHLQDKLICLSDANLIAVDKVTHNAIGGGRRVVFLPDTHSSHVAPGDVVLLKLPNGPNGPSRPEPCLVESTKLEHSMEFGTNLTVSLRTLDQHLNPYGYLLESL